MTGLRLLWRDWRGGELGVLTAALIVAVAIVSGIALFADRMQQVIVGQSSHFLAADRVLKSPRPVPDEWLQQGAAMGLRQAQVINFQSMVYAGESPDAPMQLVSVKAVSDQYPLRGSLRISDRAFGTGVDSRRGPEPGRVWLDSRLLPLLGIEPGDSVYVGDARLTVERIVISEPDRSSGFLAFGPRLLMHIDDLPATHIIQPGSRVEYRYLFAGAGETLAEYGRWLASRLQPSHKWLQLQDAQPRIAHSLERAEQFLLLAGTAGVALAGVAIALAARRYAERHCDYVAVMKTLGATSSRIVRWYLGNLLLLGVVATLLGYVLGWMIQSSFIHILQQYFAVDQLPELTLRPFVIAGASALVCLLAFALPPLWSLREVSPLVVLRRDLQRPAFGAQASYLLGIVGIGLLMWWYSGDLSLTLSVLAGVAIIVVIGGMLVWYLLRGSAALGMQAASRWRLALAALRRRGIQNAVQAVMFSLAIMLMLVLVLVRGSLIEEWRIQLPEGTPNHFLVNVSADQVAAVRQLLASQQLKPEPIYPMVRGRLVSVNGDSVSERLRHYDPSSDGSGLDRELNLTWSDVIPSDNKLEAGNWWQADSQKPEVSVESGLAKRLGVQLGDKLLFTIGSEQLAVTVTSIRSLNWDSMKPNFFMVMPAAQLTPYPSTFITSFYLPADKKLFLNNFLRDFPTITVIEMDVVIAQISNIIDQVSSAIELIMGLIICCGMLVLIASLQASLDSRFQESAILRALGAKRSLVLGSLVIEFAVLGLLAGILAAASAELVVFYLQEKVLHIDFVSHPWLWLVGPIVGALLIASTGYATCRKVVATPPMRTLKGI